VEGFADRMFQSFDFVPDHQFTALQLGDVEVVSGKVHERFVQLAFQNPVFSFQFNEMRLYCHTKSPLLVQTLRIAPTEECTSELAAVDGYRKWRGHI
jgi:hypothetical protein